MSDLISKISSTTVNESQVFSNQELVDIALDFASKSSSSNTKKTYAYGWKSFNHWCNGRGVDLLRNDNKEALISFYISEQAVKENLKVSSISCYLAGIRWHYQEKGVVINLQHPAIQKVLKGIRNTLFKRQNQKEPLLTDQIKTMVELISVDKNGEPSLIGIRDRAIILLGFAGAFRRSELVSLNVEDLILKRDGYVILLRRSKTDQEGEGIEKAIPYGGNPLTCPVRAIRDWIDSSKVSTGPLFCPINRHNQMQSKRLSSHAIALILKRNYLDEENAHNISGHSLRAGFVTSAAKRKVPEHLIMKQTGHKCSDTLKRYIRIATRFDENAASLVGL